MVIHSCRHGADVSLGGTEDVRSVLVQGEETKGATSINLNISLNSEDDFNSKIQERKSYTTLLAQGNRDNYTSQHTIRGQPVITL